MSGPEWSYRDAWMAEMRMELAIRDPRAQAIVSGITTDVGPPRLNLERLLGRGSLGMRELERDRKRYPRRRDWRSMAVVDVAVDRDAMLFVNTRTGELLEVTGMEVAEEVPRRHCCAGRMVHELSCPNRRV